MAKSDLREEVTILYVTNTIMHTYLSCEARHHKRITYTMVSSDSILLVNVALFSALLLHKM